MRTRVPKKLVPALWLAIVSCCLSACGVPNLEPQDCTDAREAVKRLYSFHLGNDLTPTAENFAARKKFLTPKFFESLKPGEDDPFTNSAEPPKTFKIGTCETSGDGRCTVQVQLYWRDDSSTVQKELKVSVIKTGGEWLVDQVLS